MCVFYPQIQKEAGLWLVAVNPKTKPGAIKRSLEGPECGPIPGRGGSFLKLYATHHHEWDVDIPPSQAHIIAQKTV